MSSLQLYVWGPALGAPSIDPRCIVIEAYLRVLGLPYTIVHANDPQTSPTGELPLLKHGPSWIAGVDRILAHLAKHGHDANANLSPVDQADAQAYKALAQERLYDCMLYTWYADMTNFVKSIRPTYAQLLAFPSKYLVPIQLKKSAKARLAKYNVEILSDDATLPENEHEEMKELQRTGWHHMYRLARETYRVLDDKLGDKSYMFGETASTLDCIVFGHLALHYYPELPHRRLQHILKVEYPRLARYCERFHASYFAEDSQLSPAAADVPSLWKMVWQQPLAYLSSIRTTPDTSGKAKPVKSDAQIEFEKKRIWSFAGGFTFLLAYIIYNGLISVEIVDDDGYEQIEYMDDEDLE
ncbi:Tom37 C-terminal domain-containing protein [Gongronella butleri]|nr:Tom37 C-terminal domain-containing protein [Gongronella butleri]